MGGPVSTVAMPRGPTAADRAAHAGGAAGPINAADAASLSGNRQVVSANLSALQQGAATARAAAATKRTYGAAALGPATHGAPPPAKQATTGATGAAAPGPGRGAAAAAAAPAGVTTPPATTETPEGTTPANGERVICEWEGCTQTFASYEEVRARAARNRCGVGRAPTVGSFSRCRTWKDAPLVASCAPTWATSTLGVSPRAIAPSHARCAPRSGFNRHRQSRASHAVHGRPG